MEVKNTKEGIPIPNEILKQLGLEDFEILTKQHKIIVRSKQILNKG